MAKRIMFQGTASTVGKSLITAAFCRIFNDDGYCVVPFKSQNMALNSFITADGKEMGRAQVLQAECARIRPDVRMNPILLKPTSHTGSQIILMGEVYQNMSASTYFSYRKHMVPYISKAFNSLNEEFEIIAIEGAGSPAEINLRDNDIVNMGLAKLIDTDVILIGDIDRGGVFASLYGTVMLLESDERSRIKGFIINKFRGDIDLLTPGIKMIEEKIQIPCLGVIPFIEQLKIDDEDSVTERFSQSSDEAIIIGVIKLPYLSNFTDFTVFEMEQDVSLRYVDSKKEIEDCDMLIIPGSKNTLHDTAYLKEVKIDRHIIDFHNSGKMIWGICGGYQILGESIYDPFEVESPIKSMEGLGLLNVTTRMNQGKHTTQSEGKIVLEQFDLSGISVEGYEIHMGVTTFLSNNLQPLMVIKSGKKEAVEGAVNAEKNVFGTYLHGLFDNNEFRTRVLNGLRQKKGIALQTSVNYHDLKENEYKRLSKVVRDNVKLSKIYDILNESRTDNC